MNPNSNGGDVESLWGKIDLGDFGSRSEREPAPTKIVERNQTKPVNWSIPAGSKPNESHRHKDLEFEWQFYRPKTRETQHAYELFLAFLQESLLKDQPRDVIRNAYDELLILLKEETKTDQEKKMASERILGPLTDDKFTQLITLSGKLVDFVAPTQRDFDQIGRTEKPSEIAVTFSDNESEDEEMIVEEEEETVPDFSESSEPDRLDLGQVSFIWLQSLLSSHYPDARSSNTVATQVFEILQQESDQQLCENGLVELLEFDKFDLIKLFLNNRFELVQCIRLNQCNTEQERKQF